MSSFLWLGIGLLGLFGVSAWLAIWSRTGTWARHGAIVLFLAGLPMIAAAGIQSLGQHRPYDMLWEMQAGDYRVLGAKMIQDKGIYLYIDTSDRPEPWPVELPWDNDTANKIQGLMDDAKGDGQFMMRYDPSLDIHGPQFHPLPQPPMLPPKPLQEPPVRFDGQEQEA